MEAASSLRQLQRFRRTSLVLASLLACISVADAQAPLPKSFVDAASVVEGLVVDMRYAGENNFVGTRIDGYDRPRCLLTAQAAAALADVQRDLAPRGLGLKAFDCYRPVRAVAHFVRWAKANADVRRKPEFYPDIDKRDLFKRGYIATRSSHSRGSTLDLTLVQLSSGAEVDMGTGFDLFSPRSAPAASGITAEQRANRQLLAAAMARRGFKPYKMEWWHFTLADEPFPRTYFDFPVR